eukprot:m.241907 g.241907  ORF g.241907 m.241907 type:complete len:425 (+) comp15831_c0_seq8:2111-3385(+)
MAVRLETIRRHLVAGRTDTASSVHTSSADTFIVAAVRTAIGGYNGRLAHYSATDLGAAAIRGALEQGGVSPAEVGEVFMGNVLSSNLGQAPARQAGINAGVPVDSPATTVNKVCASGMKAMMLGAEAILLGHQEVVVAGGMESMSNAPLMISKAETKAAEARGSSVKDLRRSMADAMRKDGLTDPLLSGVAMGMHAEKAAADFDISRQAQDEYATISYSRALQATKQGKFGGEVVRLQDKSGEWVTTDDELTRTKPTGFQHQKPAFKPEGGTVTAGNASTISDGAACVVLASGSAVARLGLRPRARLIGFADAAVTPEDFPIAPAKAIPLALQRAGLQASQIDAWEINEAFAVVVLANLKLLGINHDKVNVNGGAVALGHPIGASGARIVATLCGVLEQTGGRYGCAAICNGGGGASCVVIERL